jgi:hypothetical protein
MWLSGKESVWVQSAVPVRRPRVFGRSVIDIMPRSFSAAMSAGVICHLRELSFPHPPDSTGCMSACPVIFKT